MDYLKIFWVYGKKQGRVGRTGFIYLALFSQPFSPVYLYIILPCVIASQASKHGEPAYTSLPFILLGRIPSNWTSQLGNRSIVPWARGSQITPVSTDHFLRTCGQLFLCLLFFNLKFFIYIFGGVIIRIIIASSTKMVVEYLTVAIAMVWRQVFLNKSYCVRPVLCPYEGSPGMSSDFRHKTTLESK